MSNMARRARNWVVAGCAVACGAGAVGLAPASADLFYGGAATWGSFFGQEQLNPQGCKDNARLVEGPEIGNDCSNTILDYTGHYFRIYYRAKSDPTKFDCFSVANGRYRVGTYVYAWRCAPPYQTNEQFTLRSLHSRGCRFHFLCDGHYHIRPKADPGLCLAAQGGIGLNHDIVLARCGYEKDEQFYLSGATANGSL